MKINNKFTIDSCFEYLKVHFKDCSVSKSDGLMGPYIDIKQSFLVGVRIIDRGNNKLNIGTRTNILTGLFGIFISLFSQTLKTEVEEIIRTKFGEM